LVHLHLVIIIWIPCPGPESNKNTITLKLTLYVDFHACWKTNTASTGDPATNHVNILLVTGKSSGSVGLCQGDLSPNRVQFKCIIACLQDICLDFSPNALLGCGSSTEETRGTFRYVHDFPNQCGKHHLIICISFACHDDLVFREKMTMLLYKETNNQSSLTTVFKNFIRQFC